MGDVLGNIKLAVEWAPVLSVLSKLSAAKDSAQKADLLVKLLQGFAAKTPTNIDDVLLAKIDAALDTPAGADLFDYIVGLLKTLAEAEVTNV